MRCPTCRGTVEREAPHRPFCSERCQQIDLGRWLNEEYRISRPMEPMELMEAVAALPKPEPDADA